MTPNVGLLFFRIPFTVEHSVQGTGDASSRNRVVSRANGRGFLGLQIRKSNNIVVY
jgi:hypothetical protein